MEALAINGGTPVRKGPFVPSFHSSTEFGDLEREYILRVLDKKRVFRFLSGLEDSEAARLENGYKEMTGATYALAVNAGTSALVAALIGAGVGPGDEVVVPAYTYIATAAAVLAAKAVPVICEVDDTLTMNPKAFEAAITPFTKAVIPVHMKGVPCQMDEIMEIADRRGITVIEDVAQANGGMYKGRYLGTMGKAGCFSFQQYKVITAGEGGLIITSDQELYTRASLAHDSAVTFWNTGGFEIPSFVGENYRISEIQAALCLAQLTKLHSIVDRLRAAKQKITKGLEGAKGIEIQRIPDPEGDISTSFIFFAKDAETAQRFSPALSAEGIPNGTMYTNEGICDRHIYVNWDYVLDKRSSTPAGCPWSCGFYKGNVKYSSDMCPETLNYLGRAIHIGLHQTMSDKDCNDVVEAIRKVAEHLSA